MIIALGSNVQPETHIEKAKIKIDQAHKVLAWSVFQMTDAIGIISPPFLNGVVLIETDWAQDRLKNWLRGIESQCGRDHQSLNSITLDLDIVVWNGSVVDDSIFEKKFLEKMILEVNPNLRSLF